MIDVIVQILKLRISWHSPGVLHTKYRTPRSNVKLMTLRLLVLPRLAIIISNRIGIHFTLELGA